MACPKPLSRVSESLQIARSQSLAAQLTAHRCGSDCPKSNEKVYRFTPFSQDAQPAVRGKGPLQLAGYDISQLPMATICATSSVVWPVQPQEAARVPST